MDVPRRLRLAYSSCLDDVYCERGLVRCGAEREGQHWLSSLVASIGSNQPGAVSSYADPAANASFLPPVVTTAYVEASAPAAPHNTDPQLEHFFEQAEVAGQSATPSPGSRDDISAGPQLSRSESRVDDTQPQWPYTSSLNPFSRTARSLPASPLEPHAQEAARVESAVQASVAVEVEAEAAARARGVRVSEELAGTHEALLADVTVTLERRVRECVLKTVALDDTRQQLICAFQLPSVTSASSSRPPHHGPLAPLAVATCHGNTASPPRNQWTEQETRMRVDASTCVTTERDTASGEVMDGPAQAPAARSAAADVAAPLPWLSANRTEASLSDDVKKEMALHLYALRRQVQQLHDQLQAHESTHYRHVNALRAAQKQSRTSSSPPVRVEIVKAYEDDPVPYRKGPWKEADFAAARRGGPNRSAGGMEEDAGDESYTSDDFTGVTSAAPSALSTDDGSSGSVSSTEELFRQRQAAARRARSQQAASRSAAVKAASSSRYRVNNSSGYSSSSTHSAMTTDTNSNSSFNTTTTTSTNDDSESD